MAYIFLKTNKEELATIALCAADNLKPDGLASDKHGFVTNLIKKTIDLYAEGEKINREKKCIVSPN